MSANVGASDVSTVLAASSMVGQGPSARAELRAKTAVSRATVATSESPSEDSDDSVQIGSRLRLDDMPRPRSRRSESRDRGHADREGEAWGEASEAAALPAALQPRVRGASARADMNIPYWLRARAFAGTAPESPLAAKQRLLNAMRSMLDTELKQCSRANTTYSEGTLRALREALAFGGNDSAPSGRTMRGEPAGLTSQNLARLENVMAIIDAPQRSGDVLDRVA